MQVTFNSQIRDYNANSYNNRNTGFKAVKSDIVKRASNPAQQKTGFSEFFANILFKIKSPFQSSFTTGSRKADKHIQETLSKYNMVRNSSDVKYLKELHEALKDYPQIIAQVHLEKYADGKNSIYEANLEQMKEIHRVLADNEVVLEKIHLSANDKGKIKAHNCTLEELREIHDIFKNRPDVLTKIHFTRAHNGKFPINYATEEMREEILNLFENEPHKAAKLAERAVKYNAHNSGKL